MNAFSQAMRWLTDLLKWWIVIMPWEQGLRVRLGNRVTVLSPGMHLRIPFIDSTYKQTTRMRIISLPIQTLTTVDGKTLTVTAVLAYTIGDLQTLYQTVHQPEGTIANLVLSEIAKCVSSHTLAECSAASVEAHATDALRLGIHGLNGTQVRVVGYVVARTYRIIQDHYWTPNGMDLDEQAKAAASPG
jgi:regulator of protease activity HflC (stomatin/prohibitin superfamily)